MNRSNVYVVLFAVCCIDLRQVRWRMIQVSVFIDLGRSLLGFRSEQFVQMVSLYVTAMQIRIENRTCPRYHKKSFLATAIIDFPNMVSIYDV